MIHFSVNSCRFFRNKKAQDIDLEPFTDSLLYHTKNYQGATTIFHAGYYLLTLYHTKNYQGATTDKYGQLQ